MKVKVTYTDVVQQVVEIEMDGVIDGHDEETVSEALEKALRRGNYRTEEVRLEDREIQSFIVRERDEIVAAPQYEPEF